MTKIFRFNEFINESKTVEVKRKYNDKPAVTVGAYAPVRERVLAYMSEKGGKCTETEMNEFIMGINEETGRNVTKKWLHENTHLVTYVDRGGEKVYSLTKLGRKVHEKTSLDPETDEVIEIVEQALNTVKQTNPRALQLKPAGTVVQPQKIDEVHMSFIDKVYGTPQGDAVVRGWDDATTAVVEYIQTKTIGTVKMEMLCAPGQTTQKRKNSVPYLGA